MFGKEGTDQQGAVSSILSSEVKFTGDLDAKGSIRIDGEFEGKINSTDTVIVGRGGNVKGEIHAVHTVVSGTLEGNIFANKKVELESGSRLIGDIESMSLVIQDGVFFEGRAKMRKEGESFAAKPKITRPAEESKEKAAVKD